MQAARPSRLASTVWSNGTTPIPMLEKRPSNALGISCLPDIGRRSSGPCSVRPHAGASTAGGANAVLERYCGRRSHVCLDLWLGTPTRAVAAVADDASGDDRAGRLGCQSASRAHSHFCSRSCVAWQRRRNHARAWVPSQRRRVAMWPMRLVPQLSASHLKHPRTWGGSGSIHKTIGRC
jgi:hypothetical protein